MVLAGHGRPALACAGLTTACWLDGTRSPCLLSCLGPLAVSVANGFAPPAAARERHSVLDLGSGSRERFSFIMDAGWLTGCPAVWPWIDRAVGEMGDPDCRLQICRRNMGADPKGTKGKGIWGHCNLAKKLKKGENKKENKKKIT